jgi:hypothetical protein
MFKAIILSSLSRDEKPLCLEISADGDKDIYLYIRPVSDDGSGLEVIVNQFEIKKAIELSLQ